MVQSEAYDEKADVWAAGCILYEMAALRAPFHSSNNNILALATKVYYITDSLSVVKVFIVFLGKINSYK